MAGDEKGGRVPKVTERFRTQPRRHPTWGKNLRVRTRALFTKLMNPKGNAIQNTSAEKKAGVGSTRFNKNKQTK